MLSVDNPNLMRTTEAIIAGSQKHIIPDSSKEKISDSKIWFGKISRYDFKPPFHFLDLLHNTWNHIAIRLAIEPQAPGMT